MSESIPSSPANNEGAPLSPRPDLTVSFIGTSLLWFIQFCAAYALAETACNSRALLGTWLGVPAWQWLTVGVTFGLGAAVAWAGLRGYQIAADPASGPPEQRQRRRFMGMTGAWISVIYLMFMGYSLVLTLFVPTCR